MIALREALSNAARHAQASRVDVTVDVDRGGILAVQVTDNGTGIPPGASRSGPRNLARGEKLGGDLRLGPADVSASAPGPGWNGGYRPAEARRHVARAAAEHRSSPRPPPGI